MPKKVKTRKQKKLADLRRLATPTVTNKVDSAVYSLPEQKTAQTSSPAYALKTNSRIATATVAYSYLPGDLRKTLFITGFIIIAQLAIKFLLKV